MDRQHVVLHVAQPTTAGVANAVVPMLADQVEQGWIVHLACPPDGNLGASAAAIGVNVHEWPATRAPSYRVLGEIAMFRRILAAVNPDIMHAHSSKAGLVARGTALGKTVTVFQPHAWSFHAVHGTTKRLTVAWERFAARWTDVVVAVSDDEQRQGRAAKIRTRYVVVPNGVDASRFIHTPQETARVSLGLEDRPTALCLGRLCDQKGQDRLIKVWGDVQSRVPSAQLVFVGDGPRRASLESMVGAGNRVIFAGEHIDVAPWLAAADLVVLPSRWEAGLSLAAMEAMAASRSVVATAFEGVNQYFPKLGGVVVPQDAPLELANAVAERLESPEMTAAEGRAGYEFVAKTLDQRRQSARFGELYRELLTVKTPNLSHRLRSGQ